MNTYHDALLALRSKILAIPSASASALALIKSQQDQLNQLTLKLAEAQSQLQDTIALSGADETDFEDSIQSLESLGTQMTALTQALDAHSPDLAVAVATSPEPAGTIAPMFPLAVAVATSPQTIPSTADATPAPVANSPTPAPAQQQAPADPAQTPSISMGAASTTTTG